MEDQDGDDLLPEGWRVEYKVRKNGKKEKIIVEKAAAEGLPPGWIKEMKVKKIGNKVRRDPYYTDPVSGYVFRSMRDAVRYLETGEIGKMAIKPKDKGSHDEDLEDDKDSSPTAAKKQKLAVTETETPVTGQSTKSIEVAKDKDVINSASAGECISLSERIPDQCEASTGLNGSNLPEANDSDKMDANKDSNKSQFLSTPAVGDKMDGEKDSDKSVFLSTPAVGDKVREKDSDESAFLSTPAVESLQDKQSSESGEIRDETKKSEVRKSRSKKKKDPNLPRRASKRLAELELNGTPELKSGNQARRTAVKQSDEVVGTTVGGSCADPLAEKASQEPDQLEAKAEGSCVFDSFKSIEDSLKSSKIKHPSDDLTNANEQAGKMKMEYKSDKKQVQTDDNIDAKPDDLSFGDLWSDPCIAFAIKTLTGENFEASEVNEVSLASNDIKIEGLSTQEEGDGKLKKENKGDEKQKDLAIPEEHAASVETLTGDLPFADIWKDPCIEFAIKTLTGAIPVGYEPDNQEYFQQQHNSSQTQASNNFCQTEFLCQQYDVLEKPVSREQARTGNVSIQNPAGTSLHQHGEKRFNECH